MQKDFHYCAIAVLARAAGFTPQDALTIAYASQYVDDATEDAPFQVDGGFVVPVRTAHCGFKSCDPITQKYVFLPFHFLPDRHEEDGRLNFVTQPASALAKELITEAVGDANHELMLCRLGIALHSLADTWAHQQFSGWWSSVNDVEGIEIDEGEGFHHLIFRNIYLDYLPVVGHAEAGHLPDQPWIKFRYERPHYGDVFERSNQDLYMDASEYIYGVLSGAVGGGAVDPIPWSEIGPRLALAFSGYRDEDADERCARWQEAFGDLFPAEHPMEYDKLTWRSEALQALGDSQLDWDDLQREMHPTKVLSPRFRARSGFADSWWLRFHRAALLQQQYVLRQVAGQVAA